MHDHISHCSLSEYDRTTVNINHPLKTSIKVKVTFFLNARVNPVVSYDTTTYNVWVYDQVHVQGFSLHGSSPLAFCLCLSFHFLLSIGLLDLIFYSPMKYYTFCTSQHKQPTATLPTCKLCCCLSVHHTKYFRKTIEKRRGIRLCSENRMSLFCDEHNFITENPHNIVRILVYSIHYIQSALLTAAVNVINICRELSLHRLSSGSSNNFFKGLQSRPRQFGL